jgi:TPR repeat protein
MLVLLDKTVFIEGHTNMDKVLVAKRSIISTGISPNNELENKKPDEANPPDTVDMEEQPSGGAPSLAMHYPAAVIKRNIFMVNEVAVKVLCYLPMKNNLSLVNMLLYKINKEVTFFSLLRKLPEVNKKIEKRALLLDVAEEMQLKNASDLAIYLGKNLNSENKDELIPDALPMLEYLAGQGCPTAQYELGVLYYWGGKGIEQDYEKALGWLYKVQQKSSDACRLIGVMFYNGYGVSKDIFAAEEWMDKALALNLSNQKANFAMGVIQSELSSQATFIHIQLSHREKAFIFFQKSAELGSLEAINSMMLEAVSLVWPFGREVELAMEYLDKAINSGHSVPDQTLTRFVSKVWEHHQFTDGIKEFLLGHLYINGWGTLKDVVTGTNYLKAAVEKGHEKALLRLSDWYIQAQISKSDDALGVDLLSIKQFVIKHLEKAANRFSPHPEALYTLGAVYEVDTSEESQKKASSYFEQAVIRDKHKKALEKIGPVLSRAADHLANGEYSKAYEIYAPLAEAGDAEAKQKIAFMYMARMIAVKDKKLLLTCLEHVANQGSADAAFELGNWYMSVPIIKNYEEAIKWYEKAFYRGRAGAAFTLGLLYLNKSILLSKAELLEAQKWLKFAVDKKINGAQEKLAEVNKKLK